MAVSIVGHEVQMDPPKRTREMAEAEKTDTKKVVGKVLRGSVYVALGFLITRALFGGRTTSALDPVSRLRDIGAF